MIDPNNDIVPTLRMFDGLMMNIAADEIEMLRARVKDLEARAAAHAQPIGEDAANGAIGERGRDVDIADFLELIDAYQCAQKDGTHDERAQARIALMNAYRAALTAEKVAAEPVAWMTTDGRIATDETKNDAMANSSKAAFCIPLFAAPQQPAQSAEQDERAAIRQSAFKEAASIDAHVIAMLTADGKVSREDVDEALAKVATLSPAHACAAAPQATNPDIESIQQEFYKRGFNEGRAIGAAEARAASTQSTATQPAQTQLALTDECVRKAVCAATAEVGIAAPGHEWNMAFARAILAAQPVSGADHD
jgi:hypothetical protein